MYSFGVYIGLITIFRLVGGQYSLVTSEPFATRDKEFMLTCKIGSTEKVIRWTRNVTNVVYIRVSDCLEVDTGEGLYNSYRYNCTTSTRRYNLIIPTPRINSEADSKWKCESSGGGAESNTYTLQFYTPPTGDPVMTGYDGTPRFLGNNVILTCTVNGGIPLAALTWICKSTSIPGISNGTSRHTVTIDASYNGQRCRCTAAHPTWMVDKVVQSHVFVVHYPPTTNPVISGYDGSVRYKDDKVTLTCKVSGGSPPANLSWTCNGQQQTPVRQSTSGTTVTRDITFTMTKELNGKTCICHGRHSDTRYTPNIESNQFIVYYPPSNPFVEVHPETPFPWMEGGNGKLRCSVNDGNPPVSYEWSTSDGLISGQTTNILLLSLLTEINHRKGYRCKVTNGYTTAKNLKLVSQLKEIDVEFSAIFNSSRKFYTELNKTVDIKIPLFANPFLQNIDNISLTKQNINQKQRSDIQIRIETRNLDIAFQGKTINVEGQEIIIRIFQFNYDLQGHYTVGVKTYKGGSVSSFVFEVIKSGPPEHPKNFHLLKSTADSVIVTWLAGNDGGHQQIFVIKYQQTGKIDTLKTQNVTETGKKQYYINSISDLIPETEYIFWIYAYNVKGSTERNVGSIIPDVIRTQKLKYHQTDSNGNSDIRIVIGIVIGLIVGILGEGFVISILLWRKGILKKGKCVSGDENVIDDNQHNMQYKDIKNTREDVNGYDGILSKGSQKNQELSRGHDEYEDLDERPEPSMYQQLENKGPGAENIQMTSVYVNTTFK